MGTVFVIFWYYKYPRCVSWHTCLFPWGRVLKMESFCQRVCTFKILIHFARQPSKRTLLTDKFKEARTLRCPPCTCTILRVRASLNFTCIPTCLSLVPALLIRLQVFSYIDGPLDLFLYKGHFWAHFPLEVCWLFLLLICKNSLYIYGYYPFVAKISPNLSDIQRF